MKSKAENSFGYLVNRILHRRSVPLVGAGISVQSTKDGQPWDGHKIWELIDRALKPTLSARLTRFGKDSAKFRACALCNDCFSHEVCYQQAFRDLGVPTSSNCFLCDLRLAKEQNALTKACEAFLWEHGGANQVAYEKLVSALQIEEFTNLDPRPAHFYLAYLAREGLITEVVTTNYDCNLERAYQKTWRNESACKETLTRAVFDLDTFAAYAAISSERRPGEDTAHVLRVYKINGCAGQLKENPGHAKDILLTASQLQDWRKRKWAADYFRTKVRTSSLVTIGFGSDEPQVVHTLQQVLEEFSELTKRQPAPIFEAENAPVVTAYEHYPSFQQLQLVHGFAAWWTGVATDGDALVIGPYERAERSDGPEPPLDAPVCLPADRLWADVFQMVFARLLCSKLRDAALSENSAFTAIIPHADKLLRALAAALDACTAQQLRNPSAAGHWLAEAGGLLDATSPPRPALSRCISHVRDAGAHPDYYCAVSDHPSLAAELALLFSLLRTEQAVAPSASAVEHKWWGRVSLLPGGPIEIRLPAATGGEDRDIALYVSGRRQVEDGASMTIPMRAGPMQRVELIVGMSGSTRRLADRRAYVVDGATRKPIVIVRTDWRTIFPVSMAEASLPEVAQRLQEVVRFPSKFRRRLDSSIRTNPLLQRRAAL
ncbi:SIR2 family protein [Paraburkholderia nodosa]|uniref:SIR2 family protein n=1 Tax=Paraburkholderia nodosa TaxID=392320 RepID=UPI0009DE692C|nr:SIR2 family protein [Paraburkholderia nodosa]